MRWLPWRRRTKTRDEAKAAARAATLKEPKRHWRGNFMSSPFERFTRPLWRRRVFTSGAWLSGWLLLTWALADVIGPTGWKIGLGLLLAAFGGLIPLGRVLSVGLVSYPPWDWFSDSEAEK